MDGDALVNVLGPSGDPVMSVVNGNGETEIVNLASEMRAAISLPADLTFFKSLRLKLADEKLSEPYQQHPWVYRCVAEIAETIGQVPFRVYTGDHDEPEVVTDGPLAQLFDDPNPTLTSTQLWELTLIYLGLTKGACFWLLEGADGPLASEDELPAEIWPLDPRFMTPGFGKKTKLPEAWKYQPPGSSVPLVFQPWQLVHFKMVNPYDPINGLGPLAAGERLARTDLRADAYNEAFFRNGADPGGWLTTETDLTKQRRDALKWNWQDAHQGEDKSHRVAVLTGGMKYQPNPRTHVEMAFMEQKHEARDTICALYGVPPEIAGFGKDTYNNVQFALRYFWKHTLLSKAVYLTSVVWQKIFKPRQTVTMSTLAQRTRVKYLRKRHGGEDSRQRFIAPIEATVWGAFDLDVVEALKEDLREKLAIAKEMAALLWTVEQINDKLGLQMPINEWQKIAYAPFSQVPITELGATDGNGPGEGEPGEGEPGEGEPGEGEGKPPAEAPEEAVDGVVSTGGPAARADRVARASAWQRYVQQVLAPNAKILDGKLSRYFFGARAQVLVNLDKHAGRFEKAAGASVALKAALEKDLVLSHELRAELETLDRATSADVELILFERRAFDRKLRALARPLFAGTFSSSVGHLEKELGGLFQFELTDPAALDALEAKEIKVIGINDTLRSRLRSTLIKGVAQDETVGELQERIKREFNFTAARSLRIARTETAQVAGTARFLGMEGEGILKHRWTTAGDEVVRVSHARLDGKVVPIGEEFAAGLRYPSDPAGPAGEVINCRCVAIAVVGKAWVIGRAHRRGAGSDGGSLVALLSALLARSADREPAAPSEIHLHLPEPRPTRTRVIRDARGQAVETVTEPIKPEAQQPEVQQPEVQDFKVQP